MTKGIKRKIKHVSRKVQAEIGGFVRRGFVAGGMAAEGYCGGYADALQDVLFALNGGTPNRRVGGMRRKPMNKAPYLIRTFHMWLITLFQTLNIM